MLSIKRFLTAGLVLVVSLPVCAESLPMNDTAGLVRETEQAFAKTMKLRDFDGFLSFLSDEAIFFSGNTPLRGKAQVGEAWKPYFNDPEAPFSWKPEVVEVLASGTLALSSGPVHAADGKLLGTFSSIWRFDTASKQWKIIFDKGNSACDCAVP